MYAAYLERTRRDKGSVCLHRVLLVPGIPRLMSKPTQPVSSNCHIQMVLSEELLNLSELQDQSGRAMEGGMYCELVGA